MTSSPTERYAGVVNVFIDRPPQRGFPLRAGARALVILWAQDRPIGQVAVEPTDDPAVIIPALVSSHGGDHHDWSPPSATPSRIVSVAICSRDRPRALARCLSSLRTQTRPPDEIVVVDNASCGDQTRRVCEDAGVRYVHESRPGLDIARNTALASASGDIVAFTDDDTEIHPEWLARLAAAFDDDRVMAVTGLVLPVSLDTEAQWLFETYWGFGRGFERVDFGPDFYAATRRVGTPTWQFGAGANMAFRREVTDAVGYFDQRLDVGAAGCSGDSEYWYRLVAAGWTCRYEPSAVVHHHHRADMDGYRSQIFHYMRGHVAALLVQYEGTGDRGNLRRLCLTLPKGYLRRALGMLRHGPRPIDKTLDQEVLGCLAGVLYYVWARIRRRPA